MVVDVGFGEIGIEFLVGHLEDCGVFVFYAFDGFPGI